jgi:hypothetical protein
MMRQPSRDSDLPARSEKIFCELPHHDSGRVELWWVDLGSDQNTGHHVRFICIFSISARLASCLQSSRILAPENRLSEHGRPQALEPRSLDLALLSVPQSKLGQREADGLNVAAPQLDQVVDLALTKVAEVVDTPRSYMAQEAMVDDAFERLHHEPLYESLAKLHERRALRRQAAFTMFFCGFARIGRRLND